MSLSETSRTDIIEIGDQFYIRAQSSLADDRTRVLLHGDTFAIFDRYGDIHPVGFGKQGLFHQDTRYLSRCELRICGARPLLLSSMVREDNVLLAVDLTNPDLDLPSGRSLERGTLHIHRNKFLCDASCLERLVIHNYGHEPVEADLTITLGSDFFDIFEVRGQRRERRGVLLPTEVERTSVAFSYRGLDNVLGDRFHACDFRKFGCVAPPDFRPSGVFVPVITRSACDEAIQSCYAAR